MHPAWSVIVFTTASGMGYGLFIVLVAWQSAFSDRALIGGVLLALVAVTVGLASSTFHLANPVNAWRAFNRFRTSWLSREGLLALAFYPFALSWLAALWYNGAPSATVVAVIAALIALATVACTAMIYACLRTIPAWRNRLTLPGYLVLSLATGAVTAAAMAGSDRAPGSLVGSATAALLAGALIKILYYIYIGRPSGPAISDATGLGPGTVRLLDVGHSAGTFLTGEFGYRISPARSLQLRGTYLIVGVVIPLAILWLFRTDTGLWLAAICTLAGTMVERWLFFAEARHSVNLYHGDRRV